MTELETGVRVGGRFYCSGFYKEVKAKGEFGNRYYRNEPENQVQLKRKITRQRS